ncbi:mitochondral 37S ribosomal protein S27 [Sporothrix schenckii 1099-18]|uniref:Small ribosomal subunit protein mS33 n=1 Tax=Sporothrix schenckii 1099-18 TaxID=1397361 RepID=A0A0F2MCG3_SPOSC|nr:mitochondral 37S ribosomal protein S27 [Sporothrix schenckii 1099-18]KJR87332.1 mitochondral 37S ribosomal protein S27 [Sporothrix schenckii 1099-18]
MSVPRARLLELLKAQCRVFNMTYNPEGIRTGNKVLRQRLRGPALASYYPRKAVTIRDLQREFGPDLEAFDEWDEDRLEGLANLRARGKGNAKKKAAGKFSRK